MPTTHPRSQITHGPRVQRILRIGAQRFPGASPSEILVALAEERADEIAAGLERDPLEGLIVFGTGGRTITSEMVREALDDEW